MMGTGCEKMLTLCVRNRQKDTVYFYFYSFIRVSSVTVKMAIQIGPTSAAL